MSDKEFTDLGTILSSLSSLQTRIQKSGFERTAGLRAHMGDDCPYYRKSLDLFSKQDLRDISGLVSSLNTLLESFGRP